MYQNYNDKKNSRFIWLKSFLNNTNALNDKNMIKKVDILGGRDSQGVWDLHEDNVNFK